MSFEDNILREALKIKESLRLRAEADADSLKNRLENKNEDFKQINKVIASAPMKANYTITNKEDYKKKLIDIAEENLKNQDKKNEILYKMGYSEKDLMPRYDCSICNDTGIHENKYCTCVFDLIKDLRYKNLSKTVCLELSDFSTFNLDYYKNLPNEDFQNSYEQMSDILKYCKNWANDFGEVKNSPSILMHGKTGLGKTHLSLAIAKKVIDKGFCVAYDSTQNFLSKIEAAHFGRIAPSESPEKLLLCCDLLILDDLGTEFNSPFYSFALYNILNTRFSKNLPTIISTNLFIDELNKKYDERIISRIMGYCEDLQFLGKDIRQLRLM